MRTSIRTGIFLLACLVSLAPAVLMSRYVFSTGGANFQDDYAFYIPTLTRIWNEGWSVIGVLDGAPHGPHFIVIPLLLRCWWAMAGEWNAFTEAALSLALGVARVALIYLIFASTLKPIAMRLTMLVVASFMIFAPVQVGLYSYGDTGLTMGFDSLGFLIGLWGVTQFARSWKGVALIILGGGISAWSWGMVATWLVLFIAAVGYRFSRVQLLTLILGGVCVHAPMVQFLDRFVAGVSGGHDFFNLGLIVGALGRPLVSMVDDIGDYPLANYIGTAGIVFALSAAVIAVILGRKSKGPQGAWPALALMAWCLLYLYQVSVSRTAIGAWYVALSVYFWIALVGLCMQIGTMLLQIERPQLATSASFGLIALMAIFYVPANLSFQHKTPFLQSRTLSSEACQRHYLTAPTYCEMLLFIWPPTYDFARFSRFFEETALAAFGSSQTWTMQGDFVFNRVWLKESPDYPQVKWIRDLDHDSKPLSWKTHERLNLYLPFGQQAFWRVSLPANTKKATYRAKVHNTGRTVAALVLKAELSGAGTKSTREFLIQPGRSIDIEMGAAEWSGKDAVIGLTAAGDPRQSGLVLVYPRIDVEIRRTPAATVTAFTTRVQGRPENTELSPEEAAPNTAGDLVLEGSSRVRWDGLYDNPWLPPNGPACAGDYRALKITTAVPAAAEIRFFYALLATRAPNGNYFEDAIQVPLLADGERHTYTVDLKLLPLVKGNKIEKIRLYSLLNPSSPASMKTQVELPEVRLVRNDMPKSFCAS